jgi:hypothetical protein
MRYRLVITIDDGASAFTRIQNEIGNLRTASRPSDDIKIEALLASLGPEYEFIIAGIDVSDTTRYKDVVAKLRKAEARLKGQKQGQGQNMVNFTTTGSSNKKRRKKGPCYHCDKNRHLKKKCRKLLAEQAKSNKNVTRAQGSHAKNDYNDKGHHVAAATVKQGPKQPPDEDRAWIVSYQTQKVTTGTRTDPWYLDNAATSHMICCAQKTGMHKLGYGSIIYFIRTIYERKRHLYTSENLI